MSLRRAGFALLLLAALPARLAALAAGADFLRAEIPARPAALAGAYGAYFDDANAFLWNPAALGRVSQPLLGATHFTSIVDTQFNHAAFAQPLHVWGAKAGLGLSIQHSSTANFVQTDLAGNELGAVENYDLVLGVASGLALNKTLRIGVGAKTFNSRLAEFRSRGFAVDAGAQSDLNERVTLGVALVDVGVQEAYDKVADPLPTLFRLAVRGVLLDRPDVLIQGAAQLDRPWSTNGNITLGVGGEYWYQKVLALRAGWRFGAELGPFSLGAGFKWQGFSLDYAYNTLGELGMTHRVSLGAELGTLFQRAGWTVPAIRGDREGEGPRRVDAPEGSR
jgi:hypothetical protein